MLKSKTLAYLLTFTGVAAHGYMFWGAGEIVAAAGEQGAIFRSLYYLTIGPLVLASLLIYSITAEQGQSKAETGSENKSKKHAALYLIAALIGLSATLRAAYEIKNAKQMTGFNFNDNAKQRMEKHKTDLFEGRLKKYKRSNEDTQ